MFSTNLYYPVFLTSQGEISQVKNSVPLDPVPYQTADVVTSSNLLWYQIQREQTTPRSLGRTCAPHPSHGSRPLWENHWQFSPDKKNHTLKCLNKVLTYWQTARHVFGCQTKYHTLSLRQRFSAQMKIQLPVNSTKGILWTPKPLKFLTRLPRLSDHFYRVSHEISVYLGPTTTPFCQPARVRNNNKLTIKLLISY